MPDPTNDREQAIRLLRTTPGSGLRPREHDEDCARCFDHDGDCASELTPAEAAATPSESGRGVTLDGWSAWWPGVGCYTCGKFVGRDGSIEVTHFESSSQIASVEGQCRRCIAAEAAKRREREAVQA